MNTPRSSIDTHATGSNTDFPVTRRSLLGALGASAAVGLAGCSSVTEQSFTAPWVGMKGETVLHSSQGSRPVTLKNAETASIAETRDAGPLGELKATMNMKATSYNWQLEDEYPATHGFLSIPIPKLGGTEFAGQLDDPLNSLVTGEWGLELFNRMQFADEPVDSVEYTRIDFDFSGSSLHTDFITAADLMAFSATATMNGESTKEYSIIFFRRRTDVERLPADTDDSYVFQGYGASSENVDRFGYRPSITESSHEDFGIIDEPSV